MTSSKILSSSEWAKYVWVIGSFVQQDLREAEGLKISSPKEIQKEEKIPLREAIERYNAIFCPNVDVKTREIRVTYNNKKYETSAFVHRIIDECWIDGEWDSLSAKKLTLVTDKLAYMVKLPLDTEPDDNYFNLIPSVPREIKVKNLFGLTVKISVWNYEPKTIDVICNN